MRRLNPPLTLTSLVGPSLFLVLVWSLFLRPEHVLQKTPRLWTPSNVTVQKFFTARPDTFYSSWQLGELHQRLVTLESSEGNALEQQSILQEATRILKSEDLLTVEQFHSLSNLLKQDAEEKSVMSKVMGFFSFVNIVWFFSIIGILLSILPVVAAFAAPIFRILSKLFAFCAQLFQRFILPILIMLIPLYEIFAYLLCFLFITQGARTPGDSSLYVSLLGAFGVVLVCQYSMRRHLNGFSHSLFYTFLALAYLPLALIFQSSLFAFCAVGAFYGLIGFSVFCTGLCYCVGFDSRNTMSRVAATSVILLLGFVGLKALQVEHQYLRLFAQPVIVMGCVTYFLALLILSSISQHFIASQLHMILSLGAAFFLGSFYHLPSMVNTALTFSVLYLMERVTWVAYELKGGFIWLAILLISGAVYWISLYLHSNPQFIISLLDGSDLVR
eukprot:GILI01019553.1.p1 GENE.GILI01019553.1~~GILI01019553.1.p1  ORF type:complete len:463 (+),score=100.34 GILI01019553.1:58-1389(+)